MTAACDLIRGHCPLSQDDMPIKAVHQMSGDDNYVVGVKGVTRIMAYDEHGEMDWVPWVAIYAGERLWLRMPARNLKIYYM